MAPEQTAELSNKEEIHTMQKKLIAAAVAGLIAVPALAQTNVTISGRLATGYEHYSLSGGATTGKDAYNAFNDQSSRLIFNVNEDLGGGLSAWGQMDFRFDHNNANTIAPSGNTAMGLASKTWGKFSIGRWDVHYNEIAGGTNAGTRAGSLQSVSSFGVMSQVNGGTIANGTRTENLIMWDSPNWNGFTARLAYSTSPFGAEGVSNRAAGDPGDGSAWTGALRYANGPWKAGLSYWHANTEGDNMAPVATSFASSAGACAAATGGMGAFTAIVGGGGACAVTPFHADQRSTRVWGSYQFAMGLSVGLAYDRSSRHIGLNGGATTTFRRGAWYIPINYAFGPHKIYFDYTRAGDTSNTVGNSSASQWSLGYDYAFSKRTSAGVYYTKVNNSTAGGYDMFTRNAGVGGVGLNTAAGEDSRQWYIGMAHNF
jgi:predicted porin